MIKHTVHSLMFLVALWKLNILKFQIVFLELINKH
jgi:hypothetical protein